jgi:hypothetical protein
VQAIVVKGTFVATLGFGGRNFWELLLGYAGTAGAVIKSTSCDNLIAFVGVLANKCYTG